MTHIRPHDGRPLASLSRHLTAVLLALGASFVVVFIFWFGFARFPEAAPTKAVEFSSPASATTALAVKPVSATAPFTDISPSASLPAEPILVTPESIQALAVHDPWRALALALAAPDASSRDELLQACLRGWASTDANAATDWARSQSYLDSGLAFAAVFNGANRHPEAAVLLSQRLSQEDPENAGSYAGYLIYALGQVEKFELAASVAADSAPELRTDLLTAAYHNWGEHEPKLALAAAAALPDADSQRTALQAVLGGWAKANPRELTEVAMTLPLGPERKLALTTALRTWIDRDPAAVAAWAAHAPFFPEMEATLEE